MLNLSLQKYLYVKYFVPIRENIMDSVEKRIEITLELSRFSTIEEFAKAIGYSSTNAFSKWRTRKEENSEPRIPDSGIKKIVDNVPISQRYLETGEGVPELDEEIGISILRG